MARTPEEPQEAAAQQQSSLQRLQDDGAGAEYGVEQLLSADEEELSKVRERSGYRFTKEQLDHQADRIDESQKSV